MRTETLDCGHAPTIQTSVGTGYGTMPDGTKHCYACCGERDREQMIRDGKITLYLTKNSSYKPPTAGMFGTGGPPYWLNNWPSTLSIPIHRVSKGRHNMAGSRYDFWFRFEGENWHGVQYGENSQLARCRRLKR